MRGSEKMCSTKGEEIFRIKAMLDEDNNEKLESAIKKFQAWFKCGNDWITVMVPVGSFLVSSLLLVKP